MIDVRWTWLFLDTPRPTPRARGGSGPRSRAGPVPDPRRRRRVRHAAPTAWGPWSSCRRSPTGRAASTSTSTSTTSTGGATGRGVRRHRVGASATRSSSCARRAAWCSASRRGAATPSRCARTSPDLLDQVCLDLPEDRHAPRSPSGRAHRVARADSEEPGVLLPAAPGRHPASAALPAARRARRPGAGARRPRVRRPGRRRWPGTSPPARRRRRAGLLDGDGRPGRAGLLPHRPQPHRPAGQA